MTCAVRHDLPASAIGLSFEKCRAIAVTPSLSERVRTNLVDPHALAVRDLTAIHATLDPVSLIGRMDDLERTVEIGFKRHLLLPGLLIAAAEVVLVALPLWTLFDLRNIPAATLWRVAIPVLAGLSLLWLAVIAAYLAPIQRAVQVRRRGKRLPTELAVNAYHSTLRVPIRVLFLRTLLWALAACTIGTFLVRYADWTWPRAIQMTSLAGLHAFVVSLLRARWYASILSTVRIQLFSGRGPLQRFADLYFRRLVLVAFMVAGGTMMAVAAFLYYLLPISLEQYLGIQTYFSPALALGMTLWVVAARRLSRDLEDYFRAVLDGAQTGENPTSLAVYRHGQSLPYRLALLGLAIWMLILVGGVWIARERLRFELDDTIVMAGILLLMAIGGAIYQSLGHRETMRDLLAHLTVHHRLPIRAIRTALSLRTKLLLSFGGVVFFSCGVALFWGFVQYKNLATDFVSRQAELGLAWLRSEVHAAAAARSEPPTADLVRGALNGIDERSPEASAVFYYLSNESDNAPLPALSAELVAVGGTAGPPELPWYAIAFMSLSGDGAIDLSASLGLSGRHGRLVVSWHTKDYDLGAVAVLYPDYRSGDEATVRPLKELLGFFLLLFGACAGIVTLTVGQFFRPIRKLERRANGMARGDLAEPVSSGGEGDEIGRLTFALEEMRRALREKLRSTEEVNLDLERAVQRRTADLAKKNRELAETLDKLTRAQDQLVRAEKMASIGQLVAGIAHEINNPVNAIVNTVGPLEEAIDCIKSNDDDERREAATDVSDMVRVIQRGAQRTKDIVRALHNYSRTDDERVTDFDLNRGIDDSLELLRHLLKQNITVERDYGDVGRIRGHAGQLNQVFMNLLTNAAQALAGHPGAIIRIQTSSQNGRVAIRIQDNGGGISAEVLPRIFDPFFTTKDVGEGTGLGLSIVHGIVERHGGTIEVKSDLGVGTTFTVLLPRNSAATTHARLDDGQNAGPERPAPH